MSFMLFIDSFHLIVFQPGSGPFIMEFTCSNRAWVGFLQVLWISPTDQSSLLLTPENCHKVRVRAWLCVSFVSLSCDGLAACPVSTPPPAQCDRRRKEPAPQELVWKCGQRWANINYFLSYKKLDRYLLSFWVYQTVCLTHGLKETGYSLDWKNLAVKKLNKKMYFFNYQVTNVHYFPRLYWKKITELKKL